MFPSWTPLTALLLLITDGGTSGKMVKLKHVTL